MHTHEGSLASLEGSYAAHKGSFASLKGSFVLRAQGESRFARGEKKKDAENASFFLIVNCQLSTVNYFCGMYGKSVPGK